MPMIFSGRLISSGPSMPSEQANIGVIIWVCSTMGDYISDHQMGLFGNRVLPDLMVK